MLLILVRHGATEAAAPGVISLAESSLSVTGAADMRRLAESWSADPPGKLLCSDLARAKDSADILGAHWGMVPESDSRLREMSFGGWEGMTWDDVMRRHAADWKAWSRQWTSARVPGGEGYGDLERRVRDWLSDIAMLPNAERVVVVGHAGTIRCALAVMFELPRASAFRFRIDHASVTLVTRGESAHGDTELVRLNADTFSSGARATSYLSTWHWSSATQSSSTRSTTSNLRASSVW